MIRKALAEMTIDQLVDRFAEVGMQQDRALFKEQVHKFAEIFGEMAAIDFELRKRGREAKLALLKLYDHPCKQVQLQAARCTLAVAPVEARNVIEAIARSGRMPQAGDAGMTLDNLDRGIFKPS